MTLDTLQVFLGWCSVINIGILMFWFIIIIVARDFIYTVHSRWFKIPRDRFDAIHYNAMAYYKLTIFIFNLVPYFVLLIMN